MRFSCRIHGPRHVHRATHPDDDRIAVCYKCESQKPDSLYDVVEITAEELMPCTHPVSETIAVNTSQCPRCGKLTQAPLPLSRGERATFMATVARRSAEGWKETPVRIKSVVRYEATVRDLEAQLAARGNELTLLRDEWSRQALELEAASALLNELRAQIAARDAALGDARGLLGELADNGRCDEHGSDDWCAVCLAGQWLAAHPYKGDPDGD